MKKNLFSQAPCLQGARATLRRPEDRDAPGLQALVNSPSVYRYPPTFIFERKYADVHEAIRRLYDECMKDGGTNP